ncbi:MAG: hypothetical protein ACJ768_17670 [Gaiellaceae bacterium]
MARKAKNVALDRAQEKAKKQKKLAIILCSVLALVLVYEVPKTMKLMNSGAKAPVVEASASTPPAPNPTVTTSTPSGPPGASPAAAAAAAPAQSIVASVQVQPDPGQLTEFARFASKDPFLQSVQKSGAATAAAGSPSSKTAVPPKTKTAAPKTPPAPPPTSAVISINGELVSVTVDTDFPISGTAFSQAGAPIFHLVSLTQKSAKVAIAGGSYADGAPAITLTVGTPVTLQNTADGTRYTLLLEPQGTQVPTTTTTTTTGTTPAPASVVPSSGG